MTGRGRPPWWRWLGAALVLGTLAWTVNLLAKGWGEADLAKLSPGLLPSAIAFGLAAFSIAVAFPSFWWLVRLSGAPAPPLRELARLHFISQLMRHIPGRFVGVAYQVAVARHLASTSQWVAANATFMAMALWFAATLPIMVLSLLGHVSPGWAFLVLLALAAGPLLALHMIGRADALEIRTGVLRRFIGVLAVVANSVRTRGFARAVCWYAASWFVYGLAWSAFGMSLPGVGVQDGLVLCALYTLAWALGFVVIITPSGLGVRELAFAAMAQDFPPELVAYTAVAARFGLMSADLLLGLLSLWIGRGRNA